MEKLRRSLTNCAIRVVNRILFKSSPGLAKDIRDCQVVRAKRFPPSKRFDDARRGLSQIGKNLVRQEVRSSGKKTDVHGLHLDVTGEPKRLFPIQLRKTVIRGGESQIHKSLFSLNVLAA